MSSNPSRQINDLFESYANALEAFDTKRMSVHYHLPSTFLSDEASEIYSEMVKLEGLLRQGTSFYKQSGIAYARPEIRNKHFWTERIAEVKVRWHYSDKKQMPVYQCDYYYLVRMDKNGDWKIEVSVAVDEKEQIVRWQEGRKKMPS